MMFLTIVRILYTNQQWIQVGTYYIITVYNNTKYNKYLRCEVPYITTSFSRVQCLIATKYTECAFYLFKSVYLQLPHSYTFFNDYAVGTFYRVNFFKIIFTHNLMTFFAQVNPKYLCVLLYGSSDYFTGFPECTPVFEFDY